MKKERIYRFKLLTHLTVGNDVRVQGAEPLDIPRKTHAFKVIGKNLSNLFLINVLFFLFAIPFLVLLFYLEPKLVGDAIKDFNLMGNTGIALGEVFSDGDSVALATIAMYKEKIRISYFMLATFPLIGLGGAGLFFATRNLVWGVPFKLKQFFRGIKMHWWKFVITFTIFGGFYSMSRYAYYNNKLLMFQDKANAGSWTFLVISIILSILFVMYMSVITPMFVSHKFSFFENIKNSGILILITPLHIVLTVGFMCIPILFLLSKITKIILFIFIVSVGFAVIGVIFTELSHYLCEGFIHPLTGKGMDLLKKKISKMQSGASTDEVEEVQEDVVHEQQAEKPKKEEPVNYVKQYKKKKKKKNRNN